MNEREEVEWTDEETARIRALAREAEPPAWLEARVRRRLRGEGLPGRRSPRAPLLAAGLAGAVCFGAGFAIATRTAAPPQADYVLLLRDSPERAPSESRVTKYVRWAREARERGELVGGEKLSRDAVLLEGSETSHAAGEIGGFFLIRARSVDEAVRIARDSPHLRYGGTIELRAIEPTTGRRGTAP